MSAEHVTVIGGGLSGCAAALAASASGAAIILHEQRPPTSTSVHVSDLLCELMGRPDLGATRLDRASGLLQAELARLSPAIMECAERAKTGEESLTVDRRAFAGLVSERVTSDEAIAVVREQASGLPEGVAVIATGPTTWSPLARALHDACGEPFAFAYMGRPPVLAAESIDLSAAEWAPPYPGADPALYVPVSEDEAAEMARRIAAGERDEPAELTAETVLADEARPVERLADDPPELQGRALRGPTGPEAPIEGPALCLVPDDAEHTAFHAWHMITALTPEAQRKALAAAAALAEVEITRPAMVHRLPWIPGSESLTPTLQLKRTPRVLVAGTLAGAVGYMEALATGTMAGICAARLAAGTLPRLPSADSLTGGLCRALASVERDGPHMIRANFGMLPERQEDEGASKEQRRERQIEAALAAIERFTKERAAGQA